MNSVSRDRIELDGVGLMILEKRYLQKNGLGEVIETPADMFWRVAQAVASAEQDERRASEMAEKYYEVMAELKFLPNSPTLMNAGTELNQLSACFVLPVEDSLDSIFSAVKLSAIVHKTGGGTGFSFSRLRPAGDIVASTKGVASGPVSFIEVFNTTTDVIKQGGRRRGANMGVLSVHHPDIEAFITCKSEDGRLSNFNLSVAVTDRFMETVEKGGRLELVNPRTGECVRTVPAEDIFFLIAEKAWEGGEPGVLFIDTINRSNPVPHLGDIEATNPCGEVPLLPFESCNLGSINLSRFVTEDGSVKWGELEEVVRTAVRFLDGVIDVNSYPTQEIREASLRTRKIGLGVMGFADMLVKMGISYCSEEAERTAASVMELIQSAGREESEKLGREKGSFPAFEGSELGRKYRHMRNATVTTIAPTGSLSLIAGCSSGIEPVFALSSERVVMSQKVKIFHSSFLSYLEQCVSRGIISEKEKSGVLKTGEIPPSLKRDGVLVTAHDVDWKTHLRIQSVFQKYTDNAVSKTINIVHDSSPDVVREIYLAAWKMGLKGVTVYRDGSRKGQTIVKKEERAVSRPEVVEGKTARIESGCGRLYVTLNVNNGKPYELFITAGKAGGCVQAQMEALGRVISLSLKHGVDLGDVVRQLKGICCSNPRWSNGTQITSCADAAARAICLCIGEQLERKKSSETGCCPECSGPMVSEGGCDVCKQCGYSRCG